MTERERFEAWYLHHRGVTQDKAHKYIDPFAQEAWAAWQAAKADVEPVLDLARGVVNTEDGYLEDLFDAVDDLTAKLEHYEGVKE